MRLDSPDHDYSMSHSGLSSTEKDELAEATATRARYQTNEIPQDAASFVAESSESEGEDHGDNEEYVDVEDDIEKVTVVSLFDNAVFDDVSTMLAYVKSSYGFDLASVQKRFGEYEEIV